MAGGQGGGIERLRALAGALGTGFQMAIGRRIVRMRTVIRFRANLAKLAATQLVRPGECAMQGEYEKHDKRNGSGDARNHLLEFEAT